MAITYSKHGTFVHEEMTVEQIEEVKTKYPKLWDMMFGEKSKINKANEPEKKKVKTK